VNRNADGLYDMADILTAFENAIAAYQAIP